MLYSQRTLQGTAFVGWHTYPVLSVAPQNLAPIYEQLADAFSHAKDKVVIAKVDADGEGKPLGKKYGVTGYPSTFKT